MGNRISLGSQRPKTDPTTTRNFDICLDTWSSQLDACSAKSIATDNSKQQPGLKEIECEYPGRDIEEEIYFHGAVSGVEAKFMLKRNRSFLVRRSTVNEVNHFVLTYKWNDKHHDTLIRRVVDANEFYIYNHCALNIPELIEFHCSAKEPVNSKGAQIEYAVRRRDWSLYVQQVRIGKEIGKGEFGLVYNAEVMRLYWPNKPAVLKVLQRSTRMSNDDRSRLMREAHLMMSLRHKNVIRIYGICSDGDNLLMALERASGGSLLSYLQKNLTDERMKIRFSKDVIKGIAYLSQEGVVHRDLAARNCLVSSSFCIKVADFGLSFWGNGMLRLEEGKVPTRWLSPEVLQNSFYSTKSDTWSLGVVLYEIWSNGTRPYDTMSKPQVRKFVLNKNTLTGSEEMPQFYQQIMALCFEFDVAKRSTPAQIREILKFKKIFFSQLQKELQLDVTQQSNENQEANVS